MSAASDIALHPALRVAVVGSGERAGDLARAFLVGTDWYLAALCDPDRARAEALAAETGRPAVAGSLEELFAGHEIDAVAITTPAHTHEDLVRRALAAGKHVLVDEPLADRATTGAGLVAAAESAGAVLMAAHAECYTPAAVTIRDLIASGELGEILYVDSVRINLGFDQTAPNVFWDLAPYDLSVLDFILPGGLDPQFVAAQGADPLRSGKACVGYLSLPLANGAMAHLHVNWLSPTKVQQMVIGGRRKTLVWDDLNPQQRLSIVDTRADAPGRPAGLDAAGQGAAGQGTAISYRLENAWTPALAEPNPVGQMATAFAAAIRGTEPAPTDGRAALRVLSVLESAAESLAQGGGRTMIPDPWSGVQDPAEGPTGPSADDDRGTGRDGRP